MADFFASIRRITAAVVKEVADIVGLENLDQTLVLCPVFLQPLEFVARRAESATRCVSQGGNGFGVFGGGVDQVFGQRTHNAIAHGIARADRKSGVWGTTR